MSMARMDIHIHGMMLHIPLAGGMVILKPSETGKMWKDHERSGGEVLLVGHVHPSPTYLLTLALHTMVYKRT